MKYQKLFLLVVFVGLFSYAWGQSNEKPYWIYNLPQAKSGNYYYRVTYAEGRTYDKAYAKAFARAILESSWKLGVKVNTKDDIQTLENNITENVDVKETSMNLPMNKVCEYIEEDKSSMDIRVYILWQVAKYANVPPEFDSFNKCK